MDAGRVHWHDEVRESVADLIETFGVNSYPVDIFGIASRMGIKLVPYSSLDLELRESIISYFPDGFLRRSEGYINVREVTIFYNDINRSLERMRFTVAHELGHLYMNSDDEAVANFFAGYLLAPEPLVLRYSDLDKFAIAADFNVSVSCAEIIMEKAMSRIYSKRPLSNYESVILDNCLFCSRDKGVKIA